MKYSLGESCQRHKRGLKGKRRMGFPLICIDKEGVYDNFKIFKILEN